MILPGSVSLQTNATQCPVEVEVDLRWMRCLPTGLHRRGGPLEICSDRGGCFGHAALEEVCEAHGLGLDQRGSSTGKRGQGKPSGQNITPDMFFVLLPLFFCLT